MLELLSQEEDETCHDWASVIVEDLVDHAKELFKNEASKELLLLAIQIPADPDPDPVPARLQVCYRLDYFSLYQSANLKHVI